MSRVARRLQMTLPHGTGSEARSWPDATNTGYVNAPGYPGSLATFSGSIQSNTTYSFQNFTSGAGIGSSSVHPTNVTFIGCRFASNAVADANVACYGDNVTFQYCTFEPSADPTPPVTYANGYQYGIDQRYNGAMTVDHCNFWGWGNGIQWSFSSQAKPVIVRDSWFHDARDDGGVDHTDAILENYGGSINDHAYAVFHHNTMSSVGNTNGLALQGNSYFNITITHNYLSGFGYTLNAGSDGSGNQNVVVTDNVFSDEIQPGIGFLYGWSDGNGNLWRRNTLHLPNAPGWSNNGAWGAAITQADEGKYYYPDGTAHSVDYAG